MKRKTKNQTQALIAARQKHNKWLRKMGVHPDQLKLREKSIGKSFPDYSTKCKSVPTSDRIVAIAGKREANEYSGDYIVGLATMHKSNIVPVGRGDSAEEYAKMRR